MPTDNEFDKTYLLIKDMHDLYKNSTDNMLSTIEKIHNTYVWGASVLIIIFVILSGLAGLLTYNKISFTTEKAVKEQVQLILSPQVLNKAVKEQVKLILSPQKLNKSSIDVQLIINNANFISNKFRDIQGMDISKKNTNFFIENISQIDEKLPPIIETDYDKRLIKECLQGFVRTLPAIKKFLVINPNLKETKYIYQVFYVIIKFYFGGGKDVQGKIKKIFENDFDRIESIYNSNALNKALPIEADNYLKAIEKFKNLCL